jgi:hypothetical protein
MSTLDPSAAPPVAQEEKKQKKEPKAGDFNAGGQARFPSGPDEMGEFASFNWVAADLKGRYYLLKQITLDANVPLAVKKPDTVGPMGPEPSLFGGITLTLDARMQAPKMPGIKYDTVVGLNLTFGSGLQRKQPWCPGERRIQEGSGLVVRTRKGSCGNPEHQGRV